MLTWPDKPFIRIIRGREYEEPIDGSLAVREDPGGEYLLVSGPRAKKTVDPVCTRTDSIDDWEEVTAVPSASLKRLRDEFRGASISERRLAALLEVTSSLNRPAPPLDRAEAGRGLGEHSPRPRPLFAGQDGPDPGGRGL